MNQDNQILYDELKTPVVVFLATVIVFIGGTIYATNEIIQLLTVIVGDVSTFGKLMMYLASILNVAVMGIVLVGLYKAKSWARGAVAFVAAYFLVAMFFDLYSIFGLGVNANVIKISALTHLFCFILAAYTLYSLFSEEVTYVLGKHKLENLVLGAAVGVCLGLYGGIDDVDTTKQLQRPDVMLTNIVKQQILPRFCGHAALSKLSLQMPNYPRTTSECNASFEKSIDTCREQLAGTFASNITVQAVTAYMDKLKVCVRTDLIGKFQ